MDSLETHITSSIHTSLAYLLPKLLSHNALLYSNPNFYDIITQELLGIIQLQYKTFLSTIDEHDVTSYVRTKVSELTTHLNNTNGIPLRSYDTTYPYTIKRQRSIIKHLQYLRNIKQPDQCTPEWYHMRNNLITASNAWKALKTDSAMFSLLQEKVECDNKFFGDNKTLIDQNKTIMEDTPLLWGKKYEPVSVLYYEYKYKTVVQEYGCLIHPKYDFLGASPDGINYSTDSPVVGRMLEIKNIVNRVISGIPKQEYWIQMQLQMEVCDLNECDFLETRFKELDSYEEYVERKNKNQDKLGLMLVFLKENDLHYEYCPFGLSFLEEDMWCDEKREEIAKTGMKWYKTIYWELVECSCVLVLRNRQWFEAAVPLLSDFWSKVKYYRENQNEYETLKTERTSKRTKKELPIVPPTDSLKCLLLDDD